MQEILSIAGRLSAVVLLERLFCRERGNACQVDQLGGNLKKESSNKADCNGQDVLGNFHVYLHCGT